MAPQSSPRPGNQLETGVCAAVAKAAEFNGLASPTPDDHIVAVQLPVAASVRRRFWGVQRSPWKRQTSLRSACGRRLKRFRPPVWSCHA